MGDHGFSCKYNDEGGLNAFYLSQSTQQLALNNRRVSHATSLDFMYFSSCFPMYAISHAIANALPCNRVFSSVGGPLTAFRAISWFSFAMLNIMSGFALLSGVRFSAGIIARDNINIKEIINIGRAHPLFLPFFANPRRPLFPTAMPWIMRRGFYILL